MAENTNKAMTPEQALQIVSDEIQTLPKIAAMMRADGRFIDETDAVRRLTEARATLARVLEVADGLAEAVEERGRLFELRDVEGIIRQDDAINAALTAYRAARGDEKEKNGA